MFDQEFRMCKKCERIVPEDKMFSLYKKRWDVTKICNRCAEEVGRQAMRLAMTAEAFKYNQTVPKPKK